MMIKAIDKKKLIISSVGFLIYLILVFKFARLSEFNTDEIWAWDIASDLNFFEITQLMHYEGHSFLWYLVLKPVTLLSKYFPMIYPDAIKYTNLLFLLGAMFLVWFLSPFNIWIKSLISLSSPFLTVYSSLARPYSLSIFILFSIAALYKNRFKHPLLYASLLFLSAHTCFNGVIITLVLGGFFLYDLYKQNEANIRSSKFLVPSFIIFSSLLMLLIEWIPIYPALYVKYAGNFERFRVFFIDDAYPKLYRLIHILIIFPIAQIVLYINIKYLKTNRYLIYLFFVFNIFMTFYLFFAPGANYHFYFIYIYLIVLYWIMIENCEEFTKTKPAYIASTIFIVVLSIIYSNPLREDEFWFQDKEQYQNAITEIVDILPRSSRIYIDLEFSQDLIYYLKRFNYELLTHYGDKIPSYEAYKSLYQNLHVHPEDLYIKHDKVNAYIISKEYLKMRKEIAATDVFDVFEGNKMCLDVSDIYYLCLINIPEKNKDTEEKYWRYKNGN